MDDRDYLRINLDRIEQRLKHLRAVAARKRLGPTLEAARSMAPRKPLKQRTEEPITAERIEHAMVLMAFLVASGQTRLTPLLDRLERELAIYKQERDPISRARRILRDGRIEARIGALPPSEPIPFPATHTRSSLSSRYYCSFCGKAAEEVANLIAGPGPFICNECVELCHEIEQKRLAKLNEPTTE